MSWKSPRAFSLGGATSPDGGRQRRFADYDPTLQYRPRAAHSPFCGPSFSFPSCHILSAAPCLRSRSSRSPWRALWVMLVPHSPSRRATLRGAQLRSRRSASVQPQSHSRKSEFRIDGEARPHQVVSTARGSSTGPTGDSALTSRTARTPSMTTGGESLVPE
jgi:hypothetical protein